MYWLTELQVETGNDAAQNDDGEQNNDHGTAETSAAVKRKQGRCALCERSKDKKSRIRLVKNVDRLPARIIMVQFVKIVQSRHKNLHVAKTI